MYTNMAIKITKIAYWAFPKFYTVHSKIALILSSSVLYFTKYYYAFTIHIIRSITCFSNL